MFHQLEVTTRCNYSCFYCYGRNMEQADMTWERFEEILTSIPDGDHEVSLQGEGEPTLNPRFWDMVDAVITRGFRPTTITNGSRMDMHQIVAKLPRISISLDTIDPVEANRLGRHNVSKVMENIDDLLMTMSPHRVRIMTVNYGQELQSLNRWLAERYLNDHVVQPIQPKQDYASNYPDLKPVVFHKPGARSCTYVKNDWMRFYPLDGKVLPCCFIKDSTGIDSIAQLATDLAKGNIPIGCVGCQHLKLA